MTTTIISSGQTVSGASVTSGNTEIVLSGGSSVFADIFGGSVEVQGGGTVQGGNVQSGGQADVSSAALSRDLYLAPA